MTKMKLGKDVFVALAAIVWCDGEVSPKEAESLLRAAKAWGVAGADYVAIQRCTSERVELDIIAELDLERDARFLVYALGAWLTKVDGVVVPAEGAVLERLAEALDLSDEERRIAQSGNVMAAAIMGESVSGDLIAIAREIGARAGAGFEDTVVPQQPPGD